MENQNLPQDEPKKGLGKISEYDKKKIIETVVKEVIAKESSNLSKGIKDAVWRQCKSWGGYVLTFIAIIGLIGYQVSIRRIYNQVSNKITNSITEKFAEQNIKKTLTEVATTKAESIITDEVRPEIKKMKGKIEDFETYLAKSKGDFESEYSGLTEQVSMLDARNRLFKLSDKAVNNGDRQAYEALGVTANDTSLSEDIRSAALAEWFQVKRFYIGIDRVKGQSLKKMQPDGTKIDIKIEDITTQELIYSLLNNDLWQVRVMSASALRQRKEKGVPEALLQAIRDDQRLDVVSESLGSFVAVTGYKKIDVFDSSNRAHAWWQENKDTTDLKEQQLIQPIESQNENVIIKQ